MGFRMAPLSTEKLAELRKEVAAKAELSEKGQPSLPPSSRNGLSKPTATSRRRSIVGCRPRSSASGSGRQPISRNHRPVYRNWPLASKGSKPAHGDEREGPILSIAAIAAA